MEELKGVSRFRYELNQLMETENEKDGGNLDILKLIAQQWALFIPYMEEMAKNDVQLNAKMMNPDLSFIDLVKFLCEKAYKLVVPGTRMAGMDSELVLNWIRDYYDHEGVALVKERREKAAKAELEKKELESKKKGSKVKGRKRSGKMAEAAVKAEAEKPEVPPTAKVTEINDTLTRAKPETTTEKTEAVPSVLPASREKAKVPEKVNKVEQKKTTEEVYHQMSLFDLL